MRACESFKRVKIKCMRVALIDSCAINNESSDAYLQCLDAYAYFTRFACRKMLYENRKSRYHRDASNERGKIRMCLDVSISRGYR